MTVEAAPLGVDAAAGGVPSASRGYRALVWTIVKTVLVLALLDVFVRGPFYRLYIAPRYASTGDLIADRSNGAKLGILFDVIRRAHPALRVAFVGDSTMKALGTQEQARVPASILRDLRLRFRGADIEVVDASVIGLYAGDGVLLVAKLLGEVDVVVYGMAMRALPRAPETRWVTSMSGEIDAGTLLRIVRAGGLGWFASSVSAGEVAGGLVMTSWATYAYRTEIWNVIADRATALWPALPMRRYETAASAAVSRRPDTGGLDWPPEEYAPPNANWNALDVMAGLCEACAPERCLLYAIPVNPDARDHVTDPALYREFINRLRETAERGRMTFRDFSDSMSPADFQRPVFASRSRDPVHLSGEGLTKLAALLADPIARIAGDVLAGKSSATR